MTLSEYEQQQESNDKRAAEARKQVLIDIQNDPTTLLDLLSKDDVVTFLVDHFDPANGDKCQARAAAGFLSKAVPEAIEHLVERETLPW